MTSPLIMVDRETLEDIVEKLHSIEWDQNNEISNLIKKLEGKLKSTT